MRQRRFYRGAYSSLCACSSLSDRSVGDDIMFVAKIERGTQYIVCSTLWGGGGRPGFTARRRTRSGSGDLMLGHADTIEQTKQLCEQHYAERKD